MVHPTAVVETDRIGRNATIHALAVVRQGATLGDDVVVHPHVVIEDGVVVGSGVVVFPGSYLGKQPHGAGATARVITYVPQVRIGDHCAIGPHAVVFYDVEIGPYTLLGDGASLREQVRVGSHCLLSRYVTVNYHTVIGDRTKIMDSTHITGNCRIGSDVFIGMLVSTANDNDPARRHYDEARIRGPVIEDRATVGMGAMILPGLVIGEGAVVGTGAVVTKDVAPYDVVMGVPARVVRSLPRGTAAR
jgi:acetyltransferase-like isoleucine patch superfamily enzyme